MAIRLLERTRGGSAALIGAVAGYATVPALLCSVGVWIVFWLVVLRRTNRHDMGGVFFVVLFGVALVVSLGVIYPVTRKAADEAEISRLNSTYSQFLEKDRLDYAAEVGPLKLNETLRPAQLSLLNFDSYRDRSRQAHAIIRKYRELTDQRASDFEANIRKSHLSDVLKSRVHEKFEADRTRVQPLISRNWRLEDNGVTELDDIVDLLDRDRPGWRVSDGKLMFSDQKLLVDVQKHISVLHELSAQETELQRQLEPQRAGNAATSSARAK